MFLPFYARCLFSVLAVGVHALVGMCYDYAQIWYCVGTSVLWVCVRSG